jgi:hypothetical protein
MVELSLALILFYLIVVIWPAMEMDAIAKKGHYFLMKMKIMILKNIENETKKDSSRGL